MARVVSLRLVLTVFFLIDLQLINCDCYYPNGDLSSDGDQPCSSDSDGACCPLNWQCLSNGLCYLENEKYFGRYTCTDKTWNSDRCPNICTHNDTASGNEAVLKCKSGNYCCDANRPDAADAGGGSGCCDTSNDFFALPDGKPISSGGNDAAATSTPKPATQTSAAELSSEVVLQKPPTVPTTSPPSSNPSFTTTSTASSSSGSEENGIVIDPSRTDTSVVLITSVVINSASSVSSVIISTIAAPQSTAITPNPASTQTSSSKNLGIKIGVGVGVPVGILALAALIVFLSRRHKNRKRFSIDYTLPTDPNLIESMYKNNANLDTPYTTTTASPEINQRASGGYSSGGSRPGHTEYRGVSTGAIGMHPTAAELPGSPSRLSELSGSPPRQRDFRNSQMSELVGSIPEKAVG